MNFFHSIVHRLRPNRTVDFKHKGDNVHIMPYNTFIKPENISLGNDTYMGSHNVFYGHGGITIGDGTILAHNIEITTQNHNYDSIDLQSIPYDYRMNKKSVIIKENVWIGAHVKIIPGIVIEEGAVIGMGAVVTKDVPKCAVMGGNPAKVLKYRNVTKYDELKKQNKIYLNMKFKHNK